MLIIIPQLAQKIKNAPGTNYCIKKFETSTKNVTSITLVFVARSYSLTRFLCLHDGNETKIIRKRNHLDSLLQL